MTYSTKNVAHFLERYKTFSQDWESKYLQRLQKEFNRLKVSLTEIQLEAEEKEKKIASRYNIFHLLGIAYDEVNTHSAFLANLLNPAGTHAQKSLFLETFLEMCIAKYKNMEFPTPQKGHNNFWRIEQEKWSNFGRLDLVISNSKLSYLLVIENKIYASEEVDQLFRYARWLNSQKPSFKQQALIYLTPKGVRSYTAKGNPYFAMSYNEHIYHWLDCSLPKIEALRIRESVKQYMEIIEHL